MRRRAACSVLFCFLLVFVTMGSCMAAESRDSFEELVAVDNEECLIRITGIEEESLWGYAVNVYFENKSADKTYMYSIESASINGVDIDPFFAADVAPGKKSNEQIHFSDNEISRYGLGDVTDIELNFRVYDSDDWLADPVAQEGVHVYPLGEENAVPFVRAEQDTDVVLADNDKIKAVMTGTEIDPIWGYTLNIYLENKTETSVMFSADEVSVNGFMADPFWATSVSPERMKFTSMRWSDSVFEENGITEVENIELTLRAYNNDDFMADDYVTETITITP